MVNALFKQLIELLDGAALTQHIPVGAWWLSGLRLNAFTFYQVAQLAVLAHPFFRDFSIIRERHLINLAVFGAVLHHLARCEVVVAVGFVADCAHTAATEYAICHATSSFSKRSLIECEAKLRLRATNYNEHPRVFVPSPPKMN